MNVQELESVCAVDQYRNYSEAAFYSASSLSVISKHVSRVEDELGVRLFERASKAHNVERTEVGKAVLPLLHEMLSAYKTAVKTAQSVKGSASSLRIGYTPLVGDFKEAEIISSFLADNSDTQVFRVIDSRENLLHMLELDTLDAILLPLMVEKGQDALGRYGLDKMDDLFCQSILCNDVVCLGLPASHPLADCEVITKDKFPMLYEESFIFSTRQADSIGASQWNFIRSLLGIPQDKFKTRLIDFAEPKLALKVVEKGGGVLPQSCFVPRRTEDVVFVPVEGWNYYIDLFLVYKKKKKHGPLEKFCDSAEQFHQDFMKKKDNTSIEKGDQL